MKGVLMMKSKALKTTAAICVIGAAMWVGSNFAATAEGEGANVTPGSVEDPVVTKSYVDQKIAAIGGTNPNSNTNPTKPSAGEETDSESSGIDIVLVKAGQTLMMQDGSEAIVRVGKAVAFSSDTNGIADVTDGIDIKSGSKVPNNHLVIFPRGGRGIMPDPTQTNGLTVMVRGGYEVKASK